MRELVVRKCAQCGAIVKVINDCHCRCGIVCCDEEMKEVKANAVDASFEKHVPTYEIKDDKIIVKVNHVMEDDHYIEWIAGVSDDTDEFKYLKPGDEPVAEFKYVKGMILYSYCNKHSLWKVEVK
jgi:superoxide reductase